MGKSAGAERQARYAAKQREQGRLPYTLWATSLEWAAVKEYVANMRESSSSCNDGDGLPK